jgi:hypothetical protein
MDPTLKYALLLFYRERFADKPDSAEYRWLARQLPLSEEKLLDAGANDKVQAAVRMVASVYGV